MSIAAIKMGVLVDTTLEQTYSSGYCPSAHSTNCNRDSVKLAGCGNSHWTEALEHNTIKMDPHNRRRSHHADAGRREAVKSMNGHGISAVIAF